MLATLPLVYSCVVTALTYMDSGSTAPNHVGEKYLTQKTALDYREATSKCLLDILCVVAHVNLGTIRRYFLHAHGQSLKSRTTA